MEWSFKIGSTAFLANLHFTEYSFARLLINLSTIATVTSIDCTINTLYLLRSTTIFYAVIPCFSSHNYPCISKTYGIFWPAESIVNHIFSHPKLKRNQDYIIIVSPVKEKIFKTDTVSSCYWALTYNLHFSATVSFWKVWISLWFSCYWRPRCPVRCRRTSWRKAWNVSVCPSLICREFSQHSIPESLRGKNREYLYVQYSSGINVQPFYIYLHLIYIYIYIHPGNYIGLCSISSMPQAILSKNSLK